MHSGAYACKVSTTVVCRDPVYVNAEKCGCSDAQQNVRRHRQRCRWVVHVSAHDSHRGKEKFGSSHHPARVCIDVHVGTRTRNSLPQQERQAWDPKCMNIDMYMDMYRHVFPMGLCGHVSADIFDLIITIETRGSSITHMHASNFAGFSEGALQPNLDLLAAY